MDIYQPSALYALASKNVPEDVRDDFAAVAILLRDEEWSGWSNREIARQCAVSKDLVGHIRDEYLSEKTDIRSRTVSRDGSTYEMRTANIGRRTATVDVETGEDATLSATGSGSP